MDAAALAVGDEAQAFGFPVIVGFHQGDMAIAPLASHRGDLGILDEELGQARGEQRKLEHRRQRRVRRRGHEDETRRLVRAFARCAVAVDAAVPAFARIVWGPEAIGEFQAHLAGIEIEADGHYHARHALEVIQIEQDIGPDVGRVPGEGREQIAVGADGDGTIVNVRFVVVELGRLHAITLLAFGAEAEVGHAVDVARIGRQDNVDARAFRRLEVEHRGEGDGLRAAGLEQDAAREVGAREDADGGLWTYSNPCPTDGSQGRRRAAHHVIRHTDAGLGRRATPDAELHVVHRRVVVNHHVEPALAVHV